MHEKWRIRLTEKNVSVREMSEIFLIPIPISWSPLQQNIHSMNINTLPNWTHHEYFLDNVEIKHSLMNNWNKLYYEIYLWGIELFEQLHNVVAKCLMVWYGRDLCMQGEHDA